MAGQAIGLEGAIDAETALGSGQISIGGTATAVYWVGASQTSV